MTIMITRPGHHYGRDPQADLELALANDELQLAYQPEVNLRNGELFGFEALVRWAHPVRGIVGPAEVIPLAERTGLIHPLGNIVLSTACRQLGEWGNFDPAGALTISVNVSVEQLANDRFAADVGDAIARAGIQPSQLCLEITETAMMDEALAARALARLKALGVMIAIDDFGTGYSSLSRLKRFPLDFLKIDRSFVSGLGRSNRDEIITSAVLEMSQALGLRTIAEGVETMEQLAFLTKRGCDFGQGYLWSRPTPASEALAFVTRSEPLPHIPAPVLTKPIRLTPLSREAV